MVYPILVDRTCSPEGVVAVADEDGGGGLFSGELVVVLWLEGFWEYEKGESQE